MKLKLVLIGEPWLNDKRFKLLASYFYKYDTPLMREIDALCVACIPDFVNWGPGEVFFQEPDYGRPMGVHNIGKVGLTICFSQLYDKPDRLLELLINEVLKSINRTIKEFELLPSKVQVFPEAHVSNSEGKSYFIELPPEWI